MALTKTKVSELYVAIFNRASEGAGNKFWQENSTSVAQAADEMLETQAAKDYFGTSLDSDQNFIEHIYLNTFSKTVEDDAEGIAFWVQALTDGASRGDVVAGLLEAARDPANAGDAQDQFLNRVEVSNYSADNLEGAPDNYMQALGFSGELTVTSDPGTISTAKTAVQELAVETDGEGETFLLTEALTALKNAEEAEVTFLKEVEIEAEIGGTKYETEAGEDAANETELGKFFDAAAGAIATGGSLPTSLTANDYKDLKKQALQDVDMETALTKAEADVTVATAQSKPGMTELIEAANAALADYKDSFAAKEAADKALEAELAAFAIENGKAATYYDKVMLSSDFPGSAATASVDTTIILHNGKAYTVDPAIAADGAFDIDNATEIADAKRLAELKAAKDAEVASIANLAAQEAALKEAVGAVYVLEAGAHSIADIGSKAVAGLNSAGVDFDLSSVVDDVSVYKTAADAEVYGIQKVLTVGAISAADGTLDFNDGANTKVAVTNGMTAEEAAEAVGEAFKSSADWIVTVNGDQVTFKAAKEGLTEPTVTVTNATSGDTKFGANTAEPATVNGGASAENLNDKLGTLADLEKAIADFKEAREHKAQLEDLKEAIKAAEKAITDSEADGGLGIKLLKADQNFTNGDDVYLFNADSNDETLTGFGVRGEDTIFFGEGYKLAALGEQDIIKNVGDAAQLEIFWVQNGTAVDLYVETETFGGNATGPVADNAELLKVTLAGVTGEDLSLNDGFLTIA